HARLGTAIRITLAPAALPHPEEYSLSADNAGILIRAHDSQGAFWGVHTLLTLLEQAKRDPRGFQAEIPTLHDWPDTPARAFMIQGAWTHNANDLKRTLDLLARLHVTYFALEFGPQVMLDFNPGIAEGARFSKAQAKAIIDYGRSLGLKPIAYLNLLGHL